MIYRKTIKRSEINACKSMAEVKALRAFRAAELLSEAGAPYYTPIYIDNNFDTDDIILACEWPTGAAA